MIVRKTTPEEGRRINELFAICFEMPYSNCPVDPEQDTDTHWAAFDEDGAMMSNFTIPEYQIHFDGNLCKMGGIGGVATLPQYRRRGGIRACFKEALPDMYRNGYEFSYLYPFSTSFYRQFGYETCVQKFDWQVKLASLQPRKVAGSFHLAEKHNSMTDAIRALDSIWEREFNMMVRHEKENYQWTKECDPAVKQEFTYVYFDAEGAPKAYTTFKVVSQNDGRNLECSRFCFADPEGFHGLMALFKSLAADHTYAKFKTPALHGLQYLLPEWNLGAVKWELLHNAGMVRVINAAKVLEKARYRGTGRAVLQLRDAMIPENNGTFAVSFENGRCVHVEVTEELPHAVMEISTFSALIAGVCDFSEARYTFQGLEVTAETDVLEQIFFRKPMMIVDFF